MKAVKVNNLKKKTDQNSLNTISIVYAYNTASLRKNFHGRLLSIRVFFTDGHYGLMVSLRG